MNFRKLRLLAVGQIAALFLGVLMLSNGAATAQPAGTNLNEGILSIVWGDPRPGESGGATIFSLTTADGTTHRLKMDVGLQNQAIQYFGKHIEVFGLQNFSEEGSSEISVSRIEQAASAEALPAFSATGTRRVLYILLRYKGDTQEPHSPKFFKKLTNPVSPPAARWKIPATINGYFARTSWGKLKWKADATEWMTLPQNKNHYAGCGWGSVCAKLTQIANDGMDLAKGAGFDLTLYDNVSFVLNNDLDCCAWGGNTYYDGRSYGATWEPPWGQETGVYVHEYGHSIGLPHSGWVYYDYDSPWDMMSDTTAASSVVCSTYQSANAGVMRSLECTEPGSGFITPHKDFLGWIPDSNTVVINRTGTRDIVLHGNEFPLQGRKRKMIKICLKGKSCTGSRAHYLTVEARIGGAKYDDGLPGNGVIIHEFKANRGPIGGGNQCFWSSGSGWAVPVDATKGDYQGEPDCDQGARIWPNYALGNAQFKPGDVYRKRKWGIKVKVLKKKGDSYVVRVSRSK